MEDYPNPTLREVIEKYYPDKKERKVVEEICVTLKRKRLNDNMEINIKLMSDVSRVSEDKCREYISFYEGLLLDTKYVIK